MNYMESKKKLDELRMENEVLFRMAISYLMDTGIQHFTEENVTRTCAEIMKQDDSHSFMSNKFQCELVKTAAKIAKLDHIHILTYIGREVYWDVGDCEGKIDKCINKAISYVEDLIDLYDSNTEITDIDLCHIIEILKGRE